MSQTITALSFRYLDGKTWELLETFIVLSETLGVIEVPKGFQTDLNSIPRGLWNILPPDEYAEAGVIHDRLYRYGAVGTTLITRQQADEVHREFVRFRKAPGWKVNLMYWGLRLGGWKPWNAYRAGMVPAST